MQSTKSSWGRKVAALKEAVEVSLYQLHLR